MEAVKKKLSTLKEEKEQAVERAEEAEKAKKEAEDRAEQVRLFTTFESNGTSSACAFPQATIGCMVHGGPGVIGHYQLYAGLLPNIVSGFGEAWQRFNNNMLLNILIYGVAS